MNYPRTSYFRKLVENTKLRLICEVGRESLLQFLFLLRGWLHSTAVTMKAHLASQAAQVILSAQAAKRRQLVGLFLVVLLSPFLVQSYTLLDPKDFKIDSYYWPSLYWYALGVGKLLGFFTATWGAYLIFPKKNPLRKALIFLLIYLAHDILAKTFAQNNADYNRWLTLPWLVVVIGLVYIKWKILPALTKIKYHILPRPGQRLRGLKELQDIGQISPTEYKILEKPVLAEQIENDNNY